MLLLCCNGQRALGVCQCGATHFAAVWCCMWGRGARGNTAACLALGQLSVTSPATHKQLGHSGADSQVGGFVYILGPCGSLQSSLPGGWEFLLLLQPPQVFTARGFEALFLRNGTLGCTVCFAPQLFLPVYLHVNVGSLVVTLPSQSCSHCLARHHLHPGCLSLPFLPVWMNISSLTPSDFHTVRFSGTSGYFLFLNLLLSFFQLCEEAKDIYLCINLGWKFQNNLLSILVF